MKGLNPVPIGTVLPGGGLLSRSTSRDLRGFRLSRLFLGLADFNFRHLDRASSTVSSRETDFECGLVTFAQ